MSNSPKKRPNFTLVEPKDDAYKLLTQAVNDWHLELANCRIILAWRCNWKHNTDGHLVLGMCVRASELQKELAAYDFVILLNREVWEDAEFTTEKKLALIDHELCHAAPAISEDDGTQKLDSKGRLQWRIRQHDIEEFRGVVERHGCYKADLERFARALVKREDLPLFEGEAPKSLTAN
jgi:hypothetical protein